MHVPVAARPADPSRIALNFAIKQPAHPRPNAEFYDGPSAPTADCTKTGGPPDLVTSVVRPSRQREKGKFDGALSGANSLTHLLTDDDLTQALTQIHICLRTGDVLRATIRDNDQLLTRPASTSPSS